MYMRLISLNTWGGKVYEPLIKFIQKNSADTDIFCFQEIYDNNSGVKQYKDIIRANLLDELKTILNNFQVFYSIELAGFDDNPESVDFDLTVGKAIFVKGDIKINNYGDILLYGDRSEKNLKKDFSNLPVVLQYVQLTLNNKQFIICNIHGISFPSSKLDTKLRLNHSKRIVDFLKDKDGIKILTGDFNLLPQTNSIKLLEGNLRNLIKEFNIGRTRSNLSPYYKKPDFQKFADYTFVSKDVKVKKFEAPNVEISDHLPMILEFE